MLKWFISNGSEGISFLVVFNLSQLNQFACGNSAPHASTAFVKDKMNVFL